MKVMYGNKHWQLPEILESVCLESPASTRVTEMCFE